MTHTRKAIPPIKSYIVGNMKRKIKRPIQLVRLPRAVAAARGGPKKISDEIE